MTVLALACFTGVGRADIDTYTVDGQPVLLYKLIQWWYDAPDTEAPWICGHTLACRTAAPIQIGYTPEDRRLCLRFADGFADLVTLGPAGADRSALAFRALRRDPACLGGVSAHLGPDPVNPLGQLCLDGVAPHQADRVVAMTDGLEAVLSGPVRGMVDGAIALFPGQGLGRACAEAIPAAVASQEVTLTLRNHRTEAVLAIFAVVPAGAGPAPRP